MIAPGSLRGLAPRAALPRRCDPCHNVSDTTRRGPHASTAKPRHLTACQGLPGARAEHEEVVALRGTVWGTTSRGVKPPTRGIRGSAGVPTFDSRNDHSLD
ncbi:hypothetical protein E2C01_065758 [Portunus trituberculatus]|uniref:Uncharacterized protein n=1 Tax=Portunus trituberculatus TaxID=210409 RepID=A0A5B7HGE7_PORTR|nr:hypothetical protein [Portunus trituberculatus]